MPIVSFDAFFGGGGSQYPSDDEVSSFITEIAPKYNVPPQDALDTWAGEGKGAWQSNYKKRGAREPSYGPFQLLKGGPGTGFPRGLGNAFEEETGLDPSDPKNWKAATEYALRTAGKEGWGQWYGAPARLRGVKYSGQQVAQAEPMKLGPSEGKKVMSFADFAGGQKREIPQGEAREVPASEMPEVEAQDATPYEPMAWGDIGTDVANTVTSRTIDLAPTLAGLPGDIISAGEWLEGKLGINGGQNPSPLPGGEELRARMEKALPHAYTPKTNAGQLAGTAVDLAPMNIGSKAKMAQQAAALVGTSAATELGGEVAGAPGAIAGAVIASRGLTPKVSRGPQVTPADQAKAAASALNNPNTEAVKRTAQEGYKAVEAAAGPINGKRYYRFQQALKRDPSLKNLGYDPQAHPKLAALFNSMSNQVKGPSAPSAMGAMTGVKSKWTPGNVTYDQFDNIRGQAVNIARKSPDADERRMAGAVIDRLDDFMERAYRSNPKIAETVKKARGDWRTFRKSEEIDRILENAKDSAGRLTVTGNENALRDGFRRLSKKINSDQRAANMWTASERKLIRQLSRGTNMRTWLSRLGVALNNPFTRGGAILGGGGVSYSTGDPTAAMIGLGGMGAGIAARRAAGALAKRKAGQLSRKVSGHTQRSQAPLTPAAAGLLALNPYLEQ
jgi:hypothetical protein